jgi:molybdopterin molybdotransferase
MVTVSEAEIIILSQIRDYGTEDVHFEHANGRILAENITADRDLPPCNRVTMDGIAITYAALGKGIRSFKIKATIAAGDVPVEIDHEDECVEIMTGGALPDSTDTVVRYEDVVIENGTATIVTEVIKKGQNIHSKGRDKKAGDTVALAGQVIGPELVSMAASTGKITLRVKKQPTVVVITTGDELIDVHQLPTPYLVRSSNNYTMKAVLQQHALDADMIHIPDNLETTRAKLKDCLAKYDVILMSGGVSMGKFDYVPRVLEELGVTKLFHKVMQRPGKPFWFGRKEEGTLVFAFPGNPVSTFLCLHRYFIPWLKVNAGSISDSPTAYAVLNENVGFAAPLQYFMQVKVWANEQAQLIATPAEGNGSGDFANLLDSNAFMELPLEQSNFNKGGVYRIWPFKQII